MADDDVIDFSRLGGSSENSYLYNLAASTLSAGTQEMVGIHPSEELEEFRAQNPKAALATELAGMFVPYAGWVKAVKGVKALSRVEKLAESAAAAAGGVESAPFLAGAAREATMFAPFEAGRFAANAAVGDKSLWESGSEAAINTAVGGLLGGGVQKFVSMGKASTALQDLAKGDAEVLTAPAPLKLRRLDEMIAAEQDPTRSSALSDLAMKLDAQVRSELPGAGEKHLGRLVGGNADELENLFRPSEVGSTVERRRLVTGGVDPDVFRDPREWKQLAMEAGLPEDFTRNAQFPRVVKFGRAKDLENAAQRALDLDVEAREGFARIGGENAAPEEFRALDAELRKAREGAARPVQAEKAAAKVQDTIARNMNELGDGWFMAREEGDGLFVMAKKFRGGEAGGALPAAELGELPRADFSQARPHIRSFVTNSRAQGEALGIVEDVHRLSARGRTVGQIAGELAPKLEGVGGREGQLELVRGVRQSLGVPGKGSKEWKAWSQEAKQRYSAFGADPAAPTLPKGATADDAWVIFKTDRPDRFAPKAAKFANAQVAREKWIVGRDALEENLGRPGDFLTEVKGQIDRAPLENYLAISKQTGGPKGVGKYVERMTPPALKGNGATQHMAHLTREYVAPAAQQLKKSTRGNWVLNMGRMTQDMAETLAQTIVQGKAALDPGRGLFRQLMTTSGAGNKRALQDVYESFRKAEPKVWEEFVDLWRRGVSAEGAAREAAKGNIRRETAALAGELEAIDNGLMAQMGRAEAASGKDVTPIRSGHYGQSRAWDGDHMVALRDEAGRIVGMAAGNNKTQSLKRAGELRAKLEAESGRPHRVGESFIRDIPEGVPRDLIPYITSPGFTLQRGNMRGFKWDMELPTIDDFFKAHSANVYRRTRYMGNLARDSLLGKDLAALTVEDPFAYKVVTQRFNQMSGIEGEFSKAQNKIVDKVLAPVMGRNSATQIVQVTNQFLNHMMLGAMKLSYPISNILGVFQTTMPELAFLMSAPGERAAGYYVMAPAVGAKGPVGTMAVLNPLSIMGKSIAEMRKPEPALLKAYERAINERVIGDRVIEEFTGQSAKALTNLRGALESPRGFVEAVKAVSNFLPATSEKFARAHAFTSAWVMFRDVRGMTDPEQLYQASKQFVSRTQYLYSSADRPMVFTSPLGSSMGLFKNWMLNYMGTMANYAGEGLAHGNWSPLMWQTAGSIAAGGLASTPLVLAANAFTEGFADKRVMEWTYDTFNSKVADGILFGLPAALTGISFSGSMSEPGTNPMRDAAQLFSFAIADRAKYLGKGAVAAVDNWRATGQHPASDPDVRAALVRAFAPVNMYRTMNSSMDGTVRTPLTDLPQIKGLSATDVALYRMGMQPVALEKQLKVAEEMYSDKEKVKAATQSMGETYADAQKNGDSRLMQLVINRAVVQGVDISAVMRSAASRTKLMDQDLTERLSKPADRVRYENVLERE